MHTIFESTEQERPTAGWAPPLFSRLPGLPTVTDNGLRAQFVHPRASVGSMVLHVRIELVRDYVGERFVVDRGLGLDTFDRLIEM